MKTIIFGTSGLVFWQSMVIFFFVALTIIIVTFVFLFPKIQNKPGKNSIANNFGISAEELNKSTGSSSSLTTKLLSVAVILYFGWRAFAPLMQVNRVLIDENGNWKLQNLYHITLGNISKDTKVNFELVEGYSQLRSSRTPTSYAKIVTDSKTYRTVTTLPTNTHAAIKQLDVK